MTSEPQGTQISEGMQLLIGRAISDPEFRQQLIENPQQALDRALFPLSDEERRAITSTSREDREQMMTQLSERTSPGVCLLSSTINPHLWGSPGICTLWSLVRY